VYISNENYWNRIEASEESLYLIRWLELDEVHDIQKYPHLLKKIVIDKANQVWCIDITYIRLHRGLMYLVAIMDWYNPIT